MILCTKNKVFKSEDDIRPADKSGGRESFAGSWSDRGLMPQTRRVPAAPDAAHDTTFDPFGQLGEAFSWDATPHPEASTAAEPSGSSEDPAEHGVYVCRVQCV